MAHVIEVVDADSLMLSVASENAVTKGQENLPLRQGRGVDVAELQDPEGS